MGREEEWGERKNGGGRMEKGTYEAGGEAWAGSANLLVAFSSESGSALAVATITTLSATLVSLGSSYAGSGLGFLEGGGDNLVRKVEVPAEELDTLVSEVPVVVAPVELLGDVAAGLQGPHLGDHVEVGDVELDVLGSEGTLLGNHHTLCRNNGLVYDERGCGWSCVGTSSRHKNESKCVNGFNLRLCGIMWDEARTYASHTHGSLTTPPQV